MKRSPCRSPESSAAPSQPAGTCPRLDRAPARGAVPRLVASLVHLGVLAAMTALLTSCGSGQSISEGPVYPSARAQSGVADIQVFRDETVITFTNTTARDFPPCRMWINKWFSREIPSLRIGQTMTLSLHDFKDQFGEAFRAGGFFASDRPARLVLAQLELGEEMLGLIVVSPLE